MRVSMPDRDVRRRRTEENEETLIGSFWKKTPPQKTALSHRWNDYTFRSVLAEGDFLCARCREDRDIERAQRRQDAIDAAAIDEFAAKPDRVHNPSNLDCGRSPWNARPKPQPSAAYWSPLPDPEPKSEQIWRQSLDDNGWRLSRC